MEACSKSATEWKGFVIYIYVKHLFQFFYDKLSKNTIFNHNKLKQIIASLFFKF